MDKTDDKTLVGCWKVDEQGDVRYRPGDEAVHIDSRTSCR